MVSTWLGAICTLAVAPPPLPPVGRLSPWRVDLVCFGVSRPVSCVCLLFAPLFFGVLLRLVSSRSSPCRCMVVSPCVLFLLCLSRSFWLLLLLVSWLCSSGYGVKSCVVHVVVVNVVCCAYCGKVHLSYHAVYWH